MFFYDREVDDDQEDPLNCARGICHALPAALVAWAVVITAILYLAGRA